ncbi:Aminomethyltransferase [Drechslerella dactyloides]|uniref:aminomethyltransferase n=1 Tax=Drechslerella dactyloides TaxID=74499 RepID=A0AAD6IVJ6_DREDA|nr:Aminomethyltransferase [Drechslerella dactyloides]
MAPVGICGRTVLSEVAPRTHVAAPGSERCSSARRRRESIVPGNSPGTPRRHLNVGTKLQPLHTVRTLTTGQRTCNPAVHNMASRTLTRSRRLAVDLSRQCHLHLQQRTISTLLRPRVLATPLPMHTPTPRQCTRIQQVRHASDAPAAVQKTPLHALHVRHGGKMVEFGGFDMPVQYQDQSIGDSHRHVREKCGLFDVSHMVQHQFTGASALAFLESLTPSDLKSLQPFTSTLSVLLLPDGGILDDTIITKHLDTAFYVVTNAGCRTKDLAYFSDRLQEWNNRDGASDKVRHDVMNDQALVALQGPLAKDVLASILPADQEPLDTLYFGQSRFATALVDGGHVPLHIARGGYTGEDGFEISVPGEYADAFTEALLSANGGVTKLAGLGARDSLRLEAGMCLYGHDLTESITPIEGSLAWVVAKTRRARGDFPGASKILSQLKDGCTMRRVGLAVTGAPAREGTVIVDATGEKKIGYITSGCPSPTLGTNIAMGYVEDAYKKSGTELGVQVRGKVRKAVVTKMPFVPSKYHKPS